MIIKILGTGCPKCKLLEKNTKQAIDQLGIQAEIIKVEDMAEILEYDLMATPGLVVDEKVVMAGKVPNLDELIKLLPNLSDTNTEKSGCKGGNCCECGSSC